MILVCNLSFFGRNLGATDVLGNIETCHESSGLFRDSEKMLECNRNSSRRTRLGTGISNLLTAGIASCYINDAEQKQVKTMISAGMVALGSFLAVVLPFEDYRAFAAPNPWALLCLIGGSLGLAAGNVYNFGETLLGYSKDEHGNPITKWI